MSGLWCIKVEIDFYLSLCNTSDWNCSIMEFLGQKITISSSFIAIGISRANMYLLNNKRF